MTAGWAWLLVALFAAAMVLGVIASPVWWLTTPSRRRARREALEQELSDIDTWLEQVRALPPKELPPDADPITFADTCCGNCSFGTCYVDQMTGA